MVDYRDRQARLDENLRVFQRLVTLSSRYLQRRRYQAAAVYAEIAAYHATWKHCGLFVSPEVEQILVTIGRNAIGRIDSPHQRITTGYYYRETCKDSSYWYLDFWYRWPLSPVLAIDSAGCQARSFGSFDAAAQIFAKC